MKEKMILKKRKKLYILLFVLIICFLNYNINTGIPLHKEECFTRYDTLKTLIKFAKYK